MRDAVVRGFSQLYCSQTSEFPGETREGKYLRRMEAAYPIHPELFDRLYEDWSSLNRFQRTRGVLRHMAATIHALWERQDPGLLILPASIPLDDASVLGEMKQYEVLLLPQIAPTYPRHTLDRVPLWRGDSVSVKQVWDDFCRYLYLPRLKDSNVLR